MKPLETATREPSRARPATGPAARARRTWAGSARADAGIHRRAGANRDLVRKPRSTGSRSRRTAATPAGA